MFFDNLVLGMDLRTVRDVGPATRVSFFFPFLRQV